MLVRRVPQRDAFSSTCFREPGPMSMRQSVMTVCNRLWVVSSVVGLGLWVVLTSCSSPTTIASTAAEAESTGLMNVRWTLARVSGPTGAFAISPESRFGARLTVNSAYQLSGRDGCAAFMAHGHPATGGFTVSDVSETANGCLSDHGVLDATRAAFNEVLKPVLTRVAIANGILRLGTATYTLTFVVDPSTRAPSLATTPTR